MELSLRGFRANALKNYLHKEVIEFQNLKQMKILILNYEYPPLGGGAGVCTRFEAEGLAKRTHQVTVITTWFKTEKEIEINGNLTIVRLKSKRKFEYASNPVEMLSWVKFAKKYSDNKIKNKEFDICIANFAIPGGIVAKHIKKTKQTPYIIVSHGQDIPFFFPSQMLKFHIATYFWIKNIVKHSEKLVLLSEEMKENADKFVGKKNINKNIIIPNGCHTDVFKPYFSKKSKEFKIIFVGRLVAQKSPFVFLQALNQLKINSKIVFEVNILGDGLLRQKMENFVDSNNLSKNVNFKGWVTKEQMINEYQSANLQVISSADEAMSIAALESLSCGLYVISTPVSGNTELITKDINGDFFNFNDYNQLFSKIELFYNEKFLTNWQLDKNKLHAFRKKYDWNEIVKQYEQQLNNILNGN